MSTQEMGGITGMPTLEKMQAMRTFAESIQESEFLPKVLRGKPHSIVYLLCIGEDLGLPWTAAMRHLYPVTKGKYDGEGNQEIAQVGIEGKALAALLKSRGWKVNVTENTDEACSITLVHPDGAEFPPERFTFAQAEAGGMTKVKYQARDGRPGGEYIKIPYNMANRANQLRWRALGRAANFHAADVVLGVSVREELEDWATTAENQAIETGSAPVAQEDYSVGEVAVGAIEAAPEAITNVSSTPAVEPVAAKPQAQKRGPRKIEQPTPAPSAMTQAPAAPEPAPAAETVAQAPQVNSEIARVEAEGKRVLALYEAKLTKEEKENKDFNKNKILGEYTRGFFGSTRIPSEILEYAPVMAPLAIDIEQNFEALKANPKQVGYEAAHGCPLTAKMKEWLWPESVWAHAKEVAHFYYPGKKAEFVRWIESNKINTLVVAEDIEAFLTVAEVSRLGAVTLFDTSLMKYAVENEATMSIIVKMLERETAGKKIVDVEKDVLEKLIDKISAMVERETKAMGEPAATQEPAPLAPPAAVEEQQDTLPFGN